MLKLSNDKTKLKRRIPFRRDALNQKECDKAMIYVEKFPEELNHEQLASIFKRAGHIKHVSIPKYTNSKQSKGFAFILFSSPDEASQAVDMFDNVVPSEFVEALSDNFIPVQGAVRGLRVMLKSTWLQTKDEMKQIKLEIAQLNPSAMFQPTHQQSTSSLEGGDQEMKEEHAVQKKQAENVDAEVGSIVKIGGLS